MPAIGLTIVDWVIILIYFAFALGIGIFDRDDLRIVLCDTRVKRELASSEYNFRRCAYVVGENERVESACRALERGDFPSFGGCTINLVEADALEEFQNRVGREYRAQTGRETLFYFSRLSADTAVLEA